MADALTLALHREAIAADGKPTKRLNIIADQLVSKAAAGDIPAIKEVFDRIDGKPQRSMNIRGPDEGKVVILWGRQDDSGNDRQS